MKRSLPVVAAFALVIAGVGGAIVLLASRDHSSLETEQQAGQATPGPTAEGPYGLPLGNVVVTYSKQSDRIRIDQLAERLGAIDTKPARAAGQALVSKADRSGEVVATNGAATQKLTDATDPRLADFVRQYLGRVDAP